jgi:hypothetical protein
MLPYWLHDVAANRSKIYTGFQHTYRARSRYDLWYLSLVWTKPTQVSKVPFARWEWTFPKLCQLAFPSKFPTSVCAWDGFSSRHHTNNNVGKHWAVGTMQTKLLIRSESRLLWEDVSSSCRLVSSYICLPQRPLGETYNALLM